MGSTTAPHRKREDGQPPVKEATCRITVLAKDGATQVTAAQAASTEKGLVPISVTPTTLVEGSQGHPHTSQDLEANAIADSSKRPRVVTHSSAGYGADAAAAPDKTRNHSERTPLLPVLPLVSPSRFTHKRRTKPPGRARSLPRVHHYPARPSALLKKKLFKTPRLATPFLGRVLQRCLAHPVSPFRQLQQPGQRYTLTKSTGDGNHLYP